MLPWNWGKHCFSRVLGAGTLRPVWSLAIIGDRHPRSVHKKEPASTNAYPFPAGLHLHSHGRKVPVHLEQMQDRDVCSSPACFPYPVDKTKLQAPELWTSYSHQCQIRFKSSSISFFSHLLPPHKCMKCLSGNRPYPRIPQDVNTGNLRLEKAAVVRTTCIINASIAAYSLSGPNHSPYASRPLSHLTGCKWGQMLWKWFAALLFVYNKKPQMKVFLKSALYEQRKMPKLQCWIKGGVDQTAAVDWLHRQTRPAKSVSHSSLQGPRCPPLTHLKGRFG